MDNIEVVDGQVIISPAPITVDLESYRADLLAKKEQAQSMINNATADLASITANNQPIIDDCDAKLAKLPQVEVNETPAQISA